MFYFQLIFDSLKLTWLSRKLWVYSLILAFFTGASFILSWIMEDSGDPSKGISAAEQAQISRFLPWILFAIAILLIIICFLAVLAVSTKNGLILGTDRADKKEKFSLNEGWRTGREKFWKIIGLEIIMSVIGLAVYGILHSPLEALYKQRAFALAIPLTILAFIIAVPAAILILFIQIFGYREIILKNQGVFKSISSSYNLFVDNWKEAVLMLLISAAVIFSISFLSGILLVTAALPLFLLALVLIVSLKELGAVIGAAALSIFFLPIILFLSALLIVFKEIFWTKFYNRIINSASRTAGGNQ